jgi:hypothetical protein
MLHINGRKASYAQIKSLYAPVMFPARPNELDMKKRGHYVEPTPRPNGDVVKQGPLEQDSEGNWRQTWVVRDFTADELEQQRLASIPQSITPRQARLALLDAGLLSQVDPAIASLESPAKEQAQIEWEYATSIERDSEWINQLGAALGLDSTGIDELFIQASGL